mmetsp:Transcript_38615/g.43863  ORF Transcript_38615/g.43863 Transcript_38615/m.43863 type:complete len:404 (+) Transcript_38615:76-1287(+)
MEVSNSHDFTNTVEILPTLRRLTVYFNFEEAKSINPDFEYGVSIRQRGVIDNSSSRDLEIILHRTAKNLQITKFPVNISSFPFPLASEKAKLRVNGKVLAVIMIFQVEDMKFYNQIFDTSYDLVGSLNEFRELQFQDLECRKCRSLLIKKHKIELASSMPSSYWNELTDHWFCHRQPKQAFYGTYFADSGKVMVSDNHIAVNLSDIADCIATGQPQTYEDVQERHIDREDVACKVCGEPLGYRLSAPVPTSQEKIYNVWLLKYKCFLNKLEENKLKHHDLRAFVALNLLNQKFHLHQEYINLISDNKLIKLSWVNHNSYQFCPKTGDLNPQILVEFASSSIASKIQYTNDKQMADYIVELTEEEINDIENILKYHESFYADATEPDLRTSVLPFDYRLLKLHI